ncbi:MAG: alpha-mannosidase, partial [Chloroflexi bacterium]
MLLRLEKLNQLTKILRTYIFRDAILLDSWRIQDELAYGTPLPAADDPGWCTVTPNDLWGKRMSWAWLTRDATIPEHFAGKPAALHIELQHLLTSANGGMYTNPEALVTITGLDTPPQAINSMHHEVLLAEHAQPMPIHIVMECFTGVSQPGDHRVRFQVAELVWIDRDVEGLYWDARVLLDALAVLPEAAPECGLYLRVLEDAFQCINWLNPPDDAFSESVRQARVILQAQLFRPVASPNNPAVPRPVVHTMGHAHIDVAWLWPLRVTRGKAARTFATALALMEQFPAYTFTQSQPHLYKMVAEDDPALFGRIKARITEGRWNATGGSWVEMDTNIPGGESLVRQFLHGMRYFQHELGVRPEVLWLPDVFGYSAALPQIMRQAGIRYFFRSNLSWNQYTRYPFDTFWWEGLDGSRVLTHLATTPETLWKGAAEHFSTYNAALTAEDMLGTWTRYKQKTANHHVMAAYGMGDGGGGPNRDMVERRARLENLAGLPQVIHSTAEQFFHAVEQAIPDNLPHWVGELYFQMHRGTYTTQSRTKRHNRKSEVLLHDAEALAAIGHLLKRPYPHDVFHAAWETVLLHQFHDILPGSSIRDVYEDAEHSYTREQHRVSQALDETLAALAQHIRYDEDMQGFAVFNTLSTSIGGPIEVTLPGTGPGEVVGPRGRIRHFPWLD